MDTQDPETLYASAWHKSQFDMAGIHSGIYKSTDAGNNWQRLAGGLPKNVPFGRSNLAVCRSNPRVVYAFIDNHAPSDGEHDIVGGEVYRSDDKGQTWARTHESSLYHVFSQYGWKFTDIHVSPDNENDLFIMGTRMYHSTDYGRNFSSITGNLPAEPINVVREDSRDRNILYIGTDLGVYASLDRGATWHSLCNNLPTTPVHDMAVHPRDNDLVIGTHGRSVFVLDVKDIPLHEPANGS